MGYQSGMGAMIHDRGGTLLILPTRDHFAHDHVTGVQSKLSRGLAFRPFVGFPELNGRIDVMHAVTVAPLEYGTAVDVPSQIDNEVTFTDVAFEHRIVVFSGDFIY